jgi:hypothetical protein
METRSDSIRLGKLAKELGRKKAMAGTIKWDGRERTAESILNRAREGTVSTWGGAPGYPREIFLHPRGFKDASRDKPSVPKGWRIGFTRTGTPYIFGTE